MKLLIKPTKMTTINFTIQGRHVSHTGEATIVESYNDGLKLADETFEGQFSTNKIGIVTERNGDTYAIYENYVDSGSDDYIYFAVKQD